MPQSSVNYAKMFFVYRSSNVHKPCSFHSTKIPTSEGEKPMFLVMGVLIGKSVNLKVYLNGFQILIDPLPIGLDVNIGWAGPKGV